MSKLTFKEFLMEVDVGDLQLAKQAQQREIEQKEKIAGQQQFKKKMSSSSPSPGDVIQARNGKYFVVKNSLKGIHVKQVSGDKRGIIPHGTKFKQSGTTPGGKPIYVIV